MPLVGGGALLLRVEHKEKKCFFSGGSRSVRKKGLFVQKNGNFATLKHCTFFRETFQGVKEKLGFVFEPSSSSFCHRMNE